MVKSMSLCLYTFKFLEWLHAGLTSDMVSDGLRQNFWKLETCMFTVWTFNMHIHSKLLEHTFVICLPCSWCDGLLDRYPLNYFSFQPVLHDWCNKGCGMCNPVCGMVHIKEPLLLIKKSSLCGGSRFPLSLSEWSFTICPTPYNRK